MTAPAPVSASGGGKETPKRSFSVNDATPLPDNDISSMMQQQQQVQTKCMLRLGVCKTDFSYLVMTEEKVWLLLDFCFLDKFPAQGCGESRKGNNCLVG